MFELPGGGGLNPLPHLADPPTSGQNSTPGGRVSTPSFVEVGMLLDSHFLLMQSLKYRQCDDLNVFSTTIIHIEDKGCPLQNYPLNFFENVNL